MFPKVASNNGHLPFWLPILGENGLISRCVEELQYALYSVGPVAAQPVSSLRICPAAGLLQTLCWRELWLQKKETKRSKGVKMTSFSLLLSMDCPKQWWEPCLRRSWMHSLSCGPAHPYPLLLLLHNPNPKAWAAQSSSFWPNSAPKEPCVLVQRPAHSLWCPLSSPFGKSGW